MNTPKNNSPEILGFDDMAARLNSFNQPSNSQNNNSEQWADAASFLNNTPRRMSSKA